MWDFESLFQKASLFARRGLNHPDPNSSEVPFWCFISLEMLARATLARINVALLADPSDGNNILFACGYPSTKSPKSIPAKTVFHRCTVVSPTFTKDDYEEAMVWINWRNEELHTGALSLNDIKTSRWMPRYFQICTTLLAYLGKTLDEFIGADHVASAKQMIEALSKDNRDTALKRIKEAKVVFEKLDVEERLRLLASAKVARASDYRSMLTGYELKCPACEGPAIVTGDLVRSTTPHDKDGDFIQEDVRIPTRLKCYACGLELSGHPLLHAIGHGDHFTKVDYLDPKDYYGIEFDPSEFYDGGYMNE